jgi:uncharacterized membrane protein YccC
VGGARFGRALQRLEPLAPEWLVTVVTPKPAAPPWAAMIRYAVAIGGALLGGVLVGQTALGGLLATGALTASFGDQGGPVPQRLRRIGAGLAGALVGLLLSRLLAQETGLLGVAIVAVAGAASAYLSAISAVASFAGLQLLVNAAVGAGLGAVSVPVLLGGFLLGAAWSTAVSVVSAVVRPERAGPRQAVLEVIDRLTEFLGDAAARRDLRTPRTALSGALADAWDQVTAARAVSSGRRDDLHRLAALIGPLTELARAGAAEPSGLDGAAERLAAVRAVVAGRRGARLHRRPVPGEAVTAALARIESVVGSPDAPAGRRPRRHGQRAVLERLLGRRTAVFAARLALCLAVAESLRLVLPLSHPYWLLLTVAVVLKPDLGSVFARGLQRTAGTVAGAVLGIVVLLLVPPGPLLLILVALLAFGFPLAAKRNYGMLSTFITPLVLILVDLAGGPTRGLATSRLLDTLLGAAIVLLIGYLPWPSTWRPRLGAGVAAAVDAIGDYAAAATGPERNAVGPVRRRAYAALQDVRGDLQSALSEPPPRSRYAAAWWPVQGQLERVADDLRSAQLIEAGPGAPIDVAADSARLATALHDVADAMRERRAPQALPVPEAGPLAAAGGDVVALRALLDGPAELPRRVERGRRRPRRRS